MLDGNEIDVVFYLECTHPDDVRRDLINIDGYDPAITVER
jgi:hypothetical protein